MQSLNKALRLYTRTMTVWVVLFGLVAYWEPAPFVALGAYMKWFFALTMFGIGVVLQPADFGRVFKQPLAVGIGVAAQFTLMPLGAWAVSRALDLEPIYAVGLVLTGAAPGAMTSNVMSYIAKADAAYSVSLTAIATLLCPLLTPLLTLVLAGGKMDVPFAAMFVDLLITVVVPLGAGFAVRYWFNDAIEKIIEVFPALSATFIIFICAVVIGKNNAVIPQMSFLLLAAVGVLNLYGMAAGYGVGTAARMPRQRRRTLAIEIGMQNAGLGVVLAQEHFDAQAALPAVFFVFICIITASMLASYWQWRDAAADGMGAG